MPALHHDKQKQVTVERRAKAYELRASGMSYPQIADRLCVSVYTVRKDIKAHMDYIPRENAQELRDIELDKLNRLELALQKKALAGNTNAINTIVKLMQHRAALMGLDRIESTEGLHAAKDAMKTIVETLLQAPTVGGEAGD